MLRAAEDMREACRGLVALLAELRDELQEGGHGEEQGRLDGQHLHAQGEGWQPDGEGDGEEEEPERSWGSHGQEDVACELPLPGQQPVCSGDDMGMEGGWAAEAGEKGAGQGRAQLPLGPRLRERVQGMGVAPWLVPPMLSPRTTVG